MTSNQELVTAVRTAKQFLTYVSAGPFQYAVAEALRLPDSYFDTFRADHRRKRDLLGDGMRAAGFEVYQPQGTYFITTDITPSARRTPSPSAARSPNAAASSPSPTPSSTTTPKPAAARFASPSASGTTFSPRPPTACDASRPEAGFS